MPQKLLYGLLRDFRINPVHWYTYELKALREPPVAFKSATVIGITLRETILDTLF